MTEARPADDILDDFMSTVRWLVDHWAAAEGEECDKLSGLAHSILSLIDGVVGDFPSLDLVCRPHPDDKAFLQAEGKDWIEDGTVINEWVMLHELLYDENSDR